MPSAKRVLNGPSTKRAKSASAKRRSRSIVPRSPASISVGKQLLPPKLNNTMTYVATVSVTCDGSGFGKLLFRANGMYDPEYAIGGHQPLGYDQLSAIYDHWYVKSSKFTLHPAYASADVPLQIACYVDDDTTTATTFDSAAERPGASFMATFIGDGAVLPKMYQSYNTKRWYGRYSEGNPDLKGQTSTDPAEEVYFVMCVSGAALFATGVFSAIVKIEYDVEWSEIKTFAQS